MHMPSFYSQKNNNKKKRFYFLLINKIYKERLRKNRNNFYIKLNEKKNLSFNISKKKTETCIHSK